MKKIKFYLQRIYRLTLSFKKQEELVWKGLKKLHIDANWRHGVFENDKIIETVFEIGKEEGASFYYMIHDGYFHCRVKILERFPVEATTDLFVLATHFNNLLTNGVVHVNVQNNYVEYHQKRETIIPLLFHDEIHSQLIRHHSTSKDIFKAFQRLVNENEAPAIIIADLLKENEERDNETK